MPLTIACFLIAIIPQLRPLTLAAAENVTSIAANQSEKPETRLQVGPVNVAPTGWRRTVNGWERAETWALLDQESKTSELSRIIIQQRQAEQASLIGKALSACMGFVRKIDPVTLVCSQLSLLALYIALVFHRESKTKRTSCPTTLSPSRSN